MENNCSRCGHLFNKENDNGSGVDLSLCPFCRQGQSAENIEPEPDMYDRYRAALKGVTDPEERSRIIRKFRCGNI